MISLGVAMEALPGETASLASAIEPLEHQLLHDPHKAVQRRAVIGHTKIIEVTPHLAVTACQRSGSWRALPPGGGIY